jgi:hypothetical protein
MFDGNPTVSYSSTRYRRFLLFTFYYVHRLMDVMQLPRCACLLCTYVVCTCTPAHTAPRVLVYSFISFPPRVYPFLDSNPAWAHPSFFFAPHTPSPHRLHHSHTHMFFSSPVSTPGRPPAVILPRQESPPSAAFSACPSRGCCCGLR